MKMATSSYGNNYDEDDDDVKIVLTEPESSTSQFLDPMGNKIGEVNLNTYDTVFQCATESFPSVNDRITWGEHDTSLLLEKYEIYIPEVGPRKRFHSKKFMWNQIATDIYEKYRVIITGMQCENRYKTICKRKKILADSNTKSNNKLATEEENSCESASTKNKGELQSLEKSEQRNQELTQQIEQCNARFLTLVDKLEKNHSQQQQRLERSIQKNREQHKVEFSALLEKLDKVNETIKQNQQQQQQIFEKMIKENQEQHKTEFQALMNVLEKIHQSIETSNKTNQNGQCHNCVVNHEKEEANRLRSRSPSYRQSSTTHRSRSPARKRNCSNFSISPSPSKYYQSPTSSSHRRRRSRSKERNYSESQVSGGKNSQYLSSYGTSDRKYDASSRSPTHSCRKSFPESYNKRRDQYR